MHQRTDVSGAEVDPLAHAILPVALIGRAHVDDPRSVVLSRAATPSIMHDRVVVVGTVDDAAVHRFVSARPAVDVVIVDLYEGVPIGSLVFMVEAQRVHEFMRDMPRVCPT